MTTLSCYYLAKNSLTNEDSIVLAVQDFITWCSLGFRHRQPGGNVFRVLSTCRIDATKVFGTIDEWRCLSRSFNLDTATNNNLVNIKSIIKDYCKGQSAVTSVCAIIGFLSYVAEFWGGENQPNNTTTHVLTLLHSLIKSRSDFALVKGAMKCRLKKIMN
ncbi:hypothetical protein EPTV-WA-183 [Eptesipox virus]|uniref:Uncharacterized protein n=1 Tax=Eptesipox virus TaxID=1329402 RepID=A0A220T663_9POXV|nr:hypothetical protein CG743_gp009 [Eptesipox virus]YP_009408134.1 hypothetical protein CG743_gp183 [Eptesipox virus]ASK51210.1 hypothetical protein EPTV-WA-009 [Eptesipox virus]ASK51384.1 hypothetical protein EPTV-WA-183 [Eptesipox virus]WAH70968.1 hypothetical protein CG743_gp009 [Eptesipox virus]WAH71142.1 hypothetical protein CG743_gp183 [Eptesipox virus]